MATAICVVNGTAGTGKRSVRATARRGSDSELTTLLGHYNRSVRIVTLRGKCAGRLLRLRDETNSGFICHVLHQIRRPLIAERHNSAVQFVEPLLRSE
jgi:hypothetical protein